jgi:hypothetical protein
MHNISLEDEFIASEHEKKTHENYYGLTGCNPMYFST